jgi:homoserine O-acetyltransferase
MRLTSALCALILSSLGLAALPMAAQALPPAKEGDFVLKDFHFNSGETLPELRIHYTTLGEPRRDAKGHVVNAVLMLHGTGGSGTSMIGGEFEKILFKPGGQLDPAKYYLIFPDGIGHGKSSKPSDGLRMKFPRYDYDDMVRVQYALVTKQLGVDHLRLILGTSMGCMHAFMWGEDWPDVIDALMPLACNAGPIVGRNRQHRVLEIMAVKADPAWKGGDYVEEPVSGLTGAAVGLILGGSATLRAQADMPTTEAVDKRMAESVARIVARTDANDLIYYKDASRNYDPNLGLEKIKAQVMWINSADDFLNPPELGLAEKDVKRIRNGRFVVIPASAATNGHATHSMPSVWGQYLAELMRRSEPE